MWDVRNPSAPGEGGRAGWRSWGCDPWRGSSPWGSFPGPLGEPREETGPGTIRPVGAGAQPALPQAVPAAPKGSCFDPAEPAPLGRFPIEMGSGRSPSRWGSGPGRRRGASGALEQDGSGMNIEVGTQGDSEATPVGTPPLPCRCRWPTGRWGPKLASAVSNAHWAVCPWEVISNPVPKTHTPPIPCRTPPRTPPAQIRLDRRSPPPPSICCKTRVHETPNP